MSVLGILEMVSLLFSTILFHLLIQMIILSRKALGFDVCVGFQGGSTHCGNDRW